MTPAPTPDVLSAALAFWDAGCSVIPVATDGTKRPSIAWKTYQSQPATREQVIAWFTGGHPGLGVITGGASGNLELLELEGRAVAAGMLAELRDMALASGLAELWRRVTVDGFVEHSPSGGVHLLYRVLAPIGGNTKLARRPGEDGHPEVLAETRGEGGYVVVAPSHGPVHATGRPWVQALGDPGTIPDLTSDERDALHLLFRSLDRMPLPAPAAPPAATPSAFDQPDSPSSAGGISPGDDFNARASWDDVLVPHGWTHVHSRGDERFWCRPGKRASEGHSATTGYGDGDWLYVFTSSTELPTEQTLTKFAALAHLEYGGDYKATAKTLRTKGYGQAPTLTTAPTPSPARAAPSPAGPEPDTQQAAPATGGTTTITSTAGLTDVGNAELLVARHGHQIRYVPERGSWLHWGGNHWTWDDAGQVVEYAKQTVLAIPTDDDELRKHRTRSLSRRSIEAMVALARTSTAVVAPAALLDADPYALCTPGGVVDLHDGTVHPARPEDLHTRSTTVPLEQAPTPRWDAFLDDTFGTDTDIRGFVQRLAGYSCTGLVTHHVLPFLHGPGGNGKSVFLDVMRRILGDYAATAPAGFLLAGQLQHETEVARLAGLRFVICSEVNQEARFDEAKVKLLTGGDALTARFMRADHFTFTPSHHLWLMGNHQPRITDGGDGFRRRLRLIPFGNTVPEDKKVEGLDRQLVEQEGPGILAWLVAGGIDAMQGGLRAPASVLAATKVYMEEEDSFARFIEDRVHLGGGATVKANTAHVRRAYADWCSEQGERPLSPQVFGRELRTRYGIEQARSHGHRFYVGLALLADDNEPEQAHWNDR